MIVALTITIPILGLTYLIGWAVWHLLNDERTIWGTIAPKGSAYPPAEVVEKIVLSPPKLKKETPVTTRLHIPPPYYSSRGGDRRGYSISGMNSGGWSVQHRLVSRRYRRRPWLADTFNYPLAETDEQPTTPEKI